ncbi:MAG: NADPH:quinone reductase [Pseudomonadota bacterium]
MTMMQAISYVETGPTSVLFMSELAIPEPGAGEVRARVVRSGLNPSDTKSRSGWGGLTMPSDQVVPNNDGAGVIDAVGDGVDSSRIGMRVWVFEATLEGRYRGTSAEYVVVPERFAVELPDGISFDVGAALGVPAMTAHRALFAEGPIAGKTVLVTGGAGGVRHMAVQLAEWAGAQVITTVSRKEQADLLRGLSKATIIDRKRENVVERVLEETNGSGVNRIVEVDFAANIEVTKAVLAKHGTVAAYFSGHHPADGFNFPFWELLLQDRQLQLVFVYEMSREAHDQAARDINKALTDGALTAHVTQHYAFTRNEVARAHDDLDAGEVPGKAVIDVTADLMSL